MPVPIEQNCQLLLTAISQSLGQINGMAFGCERWNVPSLKNLEDQIEALTRGTTCQKAFTDQLFSSEEEYGLGDDPLRPLDLMLQTVSGVLEEYGLNDAGFEELAKATVTREEARDIVVLQLQTDWFNAVKQLTDMYGSSHIENLNYVWPYPIPPATPNRRVVR